MAIDYLLGAKCEPHELLGVERLVNLNRTRILARSALAHMREDGDARDPREIEIQLTMRSPDGDSARGVTLQDLMNQASPLDEVERATARAARPSTRASSRVTAGFAIRFPSASRRG